MMAYGWFRRLGSAVIERSRPRRGSSGVPAQTPAGEVSDPVRDDDGPDIVCFQTADPYSYYDMLVETARTVRLYCQRHGIRYEAYIGIKRGYFAWQACFNRILILKELIESGFRGWVFYLDADAYIADQNFDLKAYLHDKTDYAAIFVQTGVTKKWWDVNNGVFLLNTASSIGQEICALWLNKFVDLHEDTLRLSPAWGDIPHDQDLLHFVFYERQDLHRHLYFESPTLLNSENASFVRQVLRVHVGDLVERRRRVKANVDEVLGESDAAAAMPEVTQAQATVIVDALYKTLLGRTADNVGFEHYTSFLCDRGLEYGFQRIVENLVQSDEFKSRFAPTSDAAVNGHQAGLIASALYRAVFGREPDAYALNSIPVVLHRDGLEKGLYTVAQTIIRSQEFRERVETAMADGRDL